MNQSEFEEKYKDVLPKLEFKFKHYYKYQFHFDAKYKDVTFNIVTGGNTGDIYKSAVDADSTYHYFDLDVNSCYMYDNESSQMDDYFY